MTSSSSEDKPKYYQRDSTDEASALLASKSSGGPSTHLYKHFSMDEEVNQQQQQQQQQQHQHQPFHYQRVLKISTILIVLSLVIFPTIHLVWKDHIFSSLFDLHKKCKSCNVTNTVTPKTIMELKESAMVENIYNGAVASDMSICSDVGLAMLKDFDGNAVDAAVATALCLGVVNPYVIEVVLPVYHSYSP